MTKPKWKKFEELVAKIQRDLAPNADIKLNDKIRGTITGRIRQIDISIRKKIGQYELLIVIDCKDYKRRVDVKSVEAFIGLAKDVLANKLVMVSFRGFTEAAKTRGEKAGVDLYRIIDSGDHDWRVVVTIPVVVHSATLKSYQFKLRGTGQLAIPNVNFDNLEIFDLEANYKGLLGELLREYWKESFEGKKTGVLREVDFLGGPVKIFCKDKYYKLNIFANMLIDHQVYFKNLPLEKISGFMDEIKGNITTKEIITPRIDIVDVEKNWEKIESIEQLGFKPFIESWASN